LNDADKTISLGRKIKMNVSLNHSTRIIKKMKGISARDYDHLGKQVALLLGLGEVF